MASSLDERAKPFKGSQCEPRRLRGTFWKDVFDPKDHLGFESCWSQGLQGQQRVEDPPLGSACHWVPGSQGGSWVFFIPDCG